MSARYAQARRPEALRQRSTSGAQIAAHRWICGFQRDPEPETGLSPQLRQCSVRRHEIKPEASG
jgi:hypothetical protein